MEVNSVSAKIVLLYVTTASPQEAEAIGDALLEERLIACANLLPEMRSIYRWEGKVERASECVLILKTDSSKVPLIEARMKTLHSYQVPCLIEIPVDRLNGPYLEWLRAGLKEEKN